MLSKKKSVGRTLSSKTDGDDWTLQLPSNSRFDYTYLRYIAEAVSCRNADIKLLKERSAFGRYDASLVVLIDIDYGSPTAATAPATLHPQSIWTKTTVSTTTIKSVVLLHGRHVLKIWLGKRGNEPDNKYHFLAKSKGVTPFTLGKVLEVCRPRRIAAVLGNLYL